MVGGSLVPWGRSASRVRLVAGAVRSRALGSNQPAARATQSSRRWVIPGLIGHRGSLSSCHRTGGTNGQPFTRRRPFLTRPSRRARRTPRAWLRGSGTAGTRPPTPQGAFTQDNPGLDVHLPVGEGPGDDPGHALSPCSSCSARDRVGSSPLDDVRSDLHRSTTLTIGNSASIAAKGAQPALRRSGRSGSASTRRCGSPRCAHG